MPLLFYWNKLDLTLKHVLSYKLKNIFQLICFLKWVATRQNNQLQF